MFRSIRTLPEDLHGQIKTIVCITGGEQNISEGDPPIQSPSRPAARGGSGAGGCLPVFASKGTQTLSIAK